jgi:cysteinyl-tRNA synthetase
MKLYNTLSRQVEPVEPGANGQTGVYTCGPTVYDYPHIGNWFTFIRYDILVRTLKLAGLNPNWVLNITDVGHLVSDSDEGEDKLEKGARREGKTAQEIAEFYSDYFIAGLARLNFTKPQHLPRATDHIAEQIELIKVLEAKGYTYQISDGVYFDTAKFADYSKFAGLDMDEQVSAARIEQNPEKRRPADFALWKFSPAGTKRHMEWESPWGVGFPGWHIECSAMCLKYLGATVDIHSGGIDHIPVHHTNEIAQSQAANDKPLARIWMHTNHILINDQKISKSLSNGITLEDIEEQGFSLETLRFLVLQSHYRSQSRFTLEAMQAAKNTLENIQANFSWIYQSGVTADKPEPSLAMLDEYEAEITDALKNDLDTPRVVALLSEVSDRFAVTPASQLDVARVEAFGQFVQSAIGINILDRARYDIPQSFKQLIKQRDEARKNQDWATADNLREQLKQQGLELSKDTSFGSIWFLAKP